MDDAQSALELELGEAELLQNIEEAASFRDGLTKVVRAASKLLAQAEGSDAASTSASSENAASVMLPRLDLPKFSGNVLDWPNFWESVDASVGCKAIWQM